MYGETTIPIREALPDYPTTVRGKRLLGVDAYLNGHYWCGDRVEIYERERVLSERDGDAAMTATYRLRGEVPVAEIEGGLVEYVQNVGPYLDQYVSIPDDPVYADDADEWEWISSYARDWIASRTPRASDGSGAAVAAGASGRGYRR